jgi:hypothetical protein
MTDGSTPSVCILVLICGIGTPSRSSLKYTMKRGSSLFSRTLDGGSGRRYQHAVSSRASDTTRKRRKYLVLLLREPVQPQAEADSVSVQVLQMVQRSVPCLRVLPARSRALVRLHRKGPRWRLISLRGSTWRFPDVECEWRHDLTSLRRGRRSD